MYKTIVASLLAGFLTCIPAFAGTDMFLKIGDIKGESADKTHPDSIDVLSWSWGMSNPYTAASGGGGGSGKVSMSDLHIMKRVDKASPKLMLAVCNGQVQPQATLHFRRSGPEPFEWMKITLQNVLVTSVSNSGSQGEDRPVESISLSFSKVEVEYTSQKADGSAGEKTIFRWDLAANQSF